MVPDADTALDLFLDWADVLDDATMATLDQALSEWVDGRWGVWRPDDAADAVLIAQAWERACDVAVQLRRVDGLRAQLRSRVEDRMEYLAPLSSSPSRDPLGRFLAAVGTRQVDSHLAPVWWRIARLPDDVPLHHLRYALNGIRWLPVVEASHQGRFRPELVDFLVTVEASLGRLVGERRLTSERGRRTFLQLGRRARSLYPKVDWWLPHVESLDLSAMAGSWMAELFPEVDDACDADPSAPDRVERPGLVTVRKPRQDEEHDFMVRSVDLRKQLRADVEAHGGPRPVTLELVEALLVSQRRYAKQTGNGSPLAQSLCSFASPLRHGRPGLAAAWAREAVQWEPWTTYPWTILTRAVLASEGPREALEVAFQAVDRVPHQQPTWHELGQVLTELHCLDQAEEVFLAEIERFGDVVQGLHSLGSLYLRRGQIADAQDCFERVLVVEPTNWRGLSGLASSYRHAGTPERAIMLLEPHLTGASAAGARSLQREYDRARRGEDPRRADRKDRRSDDAEVASVLSVDDPRTQLHQARLLRRVAVRRGDPSLARAAKALLEGRGDEPDVVAEQALIDAELGEFEAAEALASRGLDRAPGDLSLRYVRGHLAVRTIERDRPEYSPGRMAEIMTALRPLSDLNPAAGPLVELQAARASLGMVDGAAVLSEQRKRLARLVEWQPQEQSEERGWWEQRVRKSMFDDRGIRDARMLTEGLIVDARGRVPEASRFLDQLQEEFVSRVAVS